MQLHSECNYSHTKWSHVASLYCVVMNNSILYRYFNSIQATNTTIFPSYKIKQTIHLVINLGLYNEIKLITNLSNI